MQVPRNDLHRATCEDWTVLDTPNKSPYPGSYAHSSISIHRSRDCLDGLGHSLPVGHGCLR